jgi:hypothetical protein
VTVAGEGHDFGCLRHRRWIRRVGSFGVRSECEYMSCELSESRSSSRVAVRFDGGRECLLSLLGYRRQFRAISEPAEAALAVQQGRKESGGYKMFVKGS